MQNCFRAKIMICRLCLDELNDFIPIFAECGLTPETNIEKVIRKYFDIELSQEEDVCSNKICTSCWYQLHDFHQFWLRIAQKQETLHWQRAAAASFVNVVEEKPTDQLVVKDEPEDVRDIVLGEPQINVVPFLKAEFEDPIEETDCIINEDATDMKEISVFNSTEYPYIYDENLKELLEMWSMPQFVLHRCFKFGIRVEQLKKLKNEEINVLIPDEHLDIRLFFKAAIQKWKESTQEIGLSNCSDYDSASSCERSYYHLNINEVLSQSSLGQQLKRNSNENQKLTPQQQNILVDLVIGEYFKRGINLSIKDIEKLSDNLIENFPSEKKDTYFIKRCGKLNARGKLYDKYKNLTKKFRKANLREKFKKHQELASGITSDTIPVPSATLYRPPQDKIYSFKTSSSSSPTTTKIPRERGYYDLNINEVISQTSLGQQLKRNVAENQRLMPKQQNILVDLVIGEYCRQGINLSNKDIEKLADKLIKHFPSEQKDTYFVRRCGKTNPKGKLYDKYKNLKRKLKKIGLVESNSFHEDSVEVILPHDE